MRRAIDRTPLPCLHPVADHTHGTHTAYVLDRCRCLPCAAANSRYETDRIRRNAYGRGDLTGAEPVRAHIRALQAAGMGGKRIAAAAGVSHGAFSKLMYGARGRPPSKRVRAQTAAALLAVRLDVAPGQVVDGTGTTRRLQALCVAGWSQTLLAARLGMLPTNFAAILHGRRRPLAVTAQKVSALFAELWNVPPPVATARERATARRIRRLAAKHGWVSALAFDDLDDPGETPKVAPDPVLEHDVDDAAVQRRIGGDRTVALTRTERLAVVERLHAQGMNDKQIATRTGIDARQVLRDRQGLDLPASHREAALAPSRHRRTA